MDIKIIVATHKDYWMPNDSMYMPLQVGKEGKKSLGYREDNTGDNISERNKNYCELTGLYWAWKNLSYDYLGLAHYRRHFTSFKAKGDKKEKVLKQEELIPYLDKYDVILPKPRNYLIETNYSQYAHAHHAIDLDKTREIIKENFPAYLEVFDKSMKQTTGHRFNMFIMKKDLVDAYCEWLFEILFQLEKVLDISDYNSNDSRVFGFVSERLLDVWLDTNKIKYLELPYVFMENQNWIIKGSNFIQRKLKNMTKD